MAETSGNRTTISRSADRPTVEEEHLTSLLRPPSAEDGPLFAQVWREVADQPTR